MLVENAICMNINLKEFDSKPQIKPQTIMKIGETFDSNEKSYRLETT